MKNKISQEDHKESPWKTLSTQPVYNNAWIKVEEHKAINPGGAPCIYGKVSFKNEAVGIIPIDKEGNTWLVGQFRYTLNEWSWEIPMGGSPKDEDPEATANRELEEETGLKANTITKLLQLHPSNSVTDEKGYVYLATELNEGIQQLETSEQDIQVRKLPFEEVLAMAQNGEITDAISLAGIFYLALNKKLITQQK
ncbi:ADP-ribose pyrophosphatase [hydrothermal vent metagenome]|uniref:ADP-ribose pyrophosphatase n=1 Tax=hydrothermal vent metagenome TaxID=652676 RepID=A0A3B0XNP2_9ZZZZ